jgi:hypothetical protein
LHNDNTVDAAVAVAVAVVLLLAAVAVAVVSLLAAVAVAGIVSFVVVAAAAAADVDAVAVAVEIASLAFTDDAVAVSINQLVVMQCVLYEVVVLSVHQGVGLVPESRISLILSIFLIHPCFQQIFPPFQKLGRLAYSISNLSIFNATNKKSP